MACSSLRLGTSHLAMQAVERLHLRPGQQPNEVQLLRLLRYIAGFYESETTKRLEGEELG